MKLKMVVVDFEIPKPVKKWVLRTGAAATVVGAAAIAWAAPTWTTFQDGQPLSAQQMNDNFAIVSPPGTIVAFAGPIDGNPGQGLDAGDGGVQRPPPPGWLYCDGAAVSRTQYAALFAAIGIAWGTGDQVNTFNLPDLRGEFLRGADNGAGRDPDVTTREAGANGGNPGDGVGSLEGDAFKNHQHPIADVQHTHQPPAATQGGSLSYPFWNSSVCTGATLEVGSGTYACFTTEAALPSAYSGITHTETTGSRETRPVNASVNYIIKD